MKRKEAREQAFCILFEHAVTGETMDEILHAAAEARDFIPNSFAEEEAFGVEENLEQIDSIISKNIRGWNMQRISKVTLALLRLSVYEILFDDTIPAGVSANEAVELAKKYGGKDDAPYINGVLSSVIKAFPAEGE
ncbi:transcription antitermination factor NusB [uncultured Neglectibacter sp.]|uniref:transcription antitermination factor NusB n=1 Tax=uncultured Neglectibacter sp. TaxID=1924108 RepID=UPI0034DDEE8F